MKRLWRYGGKKTIDKLHQKVYYITKIKRYPTGYERKERGKGMLNEKKLREKVDELNKSTIDSVEWVEPLERTDNITDGVLAGNLIPDQRFMLKEMSEKFAKLYLYDNSLGMFVGIMIVER